jgi:hypothetical protein
MSKYLVLWEGVPGTMPVDPKERAAVTGKVMEMTKQALDSRQIIDWGIFAGGDAGYAIGEGAAADMLKGSMQFSPYFKFNVHPVLSLQEVGEVMKSIMG